ncbi:DUF4179 domain-containing protein [Anaerobacillus alkaliphilus]|uniref:DUF4179 domain-containing protein n=1 Tax=Anaerobacillus alkaliphilus TaxID=1548597 RepID=A0A4V1LGV5_9BACI|nr:DUF4179 domain-containing protein [Anaerobacillus alkaliphilus]RXJ04055.1 DUF4179 domain-containing protein [Anaerobacillus alkaliphilus]
MSHNHDLMSEWVRTNKLQLYKLGYVFIDQEEALEDVVHKIMKLYQDTTDFLEEEFKQKFVKECMSKSGRATKLQEDLWRDLSPSSVQSLYFCYVLGLTLSETASYLSQTEESVEESIISGFQRLLGDADVPVQKLLNYHQGLLDFTEYKRINQLIVEDQQYSQALEKLLAIIDQFEKINRTLSPSSFFLEGNRPLTDAQLNKRKRKQQIFTITASLFFIMILFVSSVGVAEIQHKWKVWTTEQVAYGESVFVSAVDQGIEITVTHVAADETQTIVYYQVRDLEDQYHYNMDIYHANAVEVLEQTVFSEFWSPYGRPKSFYRVLDEDQTSEGMLFLPPLKGESERITLRFHTVEQYAKGLDWFGTHDSNDHRQINGEWLLEFPITKYESMVVDIDRTIQVKDKDVYFSHLVVSPTVTLLAYKFDFEKNGRYEYHDIYMSVEANGKKYLPFFDHRSHNDYRNGDWDRIFPVESIFYLKPKELELAIDRIHSTYDYDKEITINYDKLPMEFQFLDNIVTIDNIDIGNPTTITLLEEFDLDRSYDHFHMNFDHDSQTHNFGYGYYSEGIWIDGEGNKYHTYEELVEIQNPFEIQYISTKQIISLNFPGKEIDKSQLPEKILISSYSKSQKLNERLKVNLH